MNNPRLYISVDNCFASKRFNKPCEWISIIKNMGVNMAEVSADNEFDPLYSGGEHIKNTVTYLKSAGKIENFNVSGLYSGHGTYSTLGLAHTEEIVRNRIREKWLKPMVSYAAELETGLGFYCHAFADSILQDENSYNSAYETLIENLINLAKYSMAAGCKYLALEQMYSPHQVPFTIKGAKDIIKNVYKNNKLPFYITLDTGHQSGQVRFLKPGITEINERIKSGDPKWLGKKEAYDIFFGSENDKSGQILEAINKTPWLFADSDDSDTYKWFESLGGYSPIIHLQQTDGTKSAHLPFTDENNQKGIIKGEKILKALERFYNSKKDDDMPPVCMDIYFTLEIFSGTASYNYDTIKDITESVKYWRKFIPYDGITLSEALKFRA